MFSAHRSASGSHRTVSCNYSGHCLSSIMIHALAGIPLSVSSFACSNSFNERHQYLTRFTGPLGWFDNKTIVLACHTHSCQTYMVHLVWAALVSDITAVETVVFSALWFQSRWVSQSGKPSRLPNCGPKMPLSVQVRSKPSEYVAGTKKRIDFSLSPVMCCSRRMTSVASASIKSFHVLFCDANNQ